MSEPKRSAIQGEGDVLADRRYRENIHRFLTNSDPAAIARDAAEDLYGEEDEPTDPRIKESGKIGWALLWLLGVPLPVLLIIYLIRGH